MNELVKKYKTTQEYLEKYRYACFIMGFDQETDCPLKDVEHSIEVQNHFKKLMMDVELSDDYKNNIKELFKIKEQIDQVTAKSVEIEYREMAKLERIPKDELYRHIDNSSECGYLWKLAKKDGDWSKFAVAQTELINYYKQYIGWQSYRNLKGYDVLLDDMERGFTEAKYEEFFTVIEKELVPFVKTVLAKPQKYNPKLDSLKFDIDKQKKLTKRIAEIMGYTNEVGCIRETLHPFTSYANCNDVRTTTRYEESLLFSNLYSIMHEIGHALYQIQMNPVYNNTPIFNDVTCATHESQSRFYENYLGRSQGFVHYLYPILQEIFPLEFADISEQDVYYYANKASAQLIRCEADELTYPLHILLRYRVEQKLFHNEIEQKDIEKTFNYYLHEFFGITPQNKAEGCFQDVHWSGSFGYFPTYALGSAFGAQFIKAMKKDLAVEKLLAKGDFKTINKWLKEHIHDCSSLIQGEALVEKVCQEKFDPHVYVDYLKEKFTALYL